MPGKQVRLILRFYGIRDRAYSAGVRVPGILRRYGLGTVHRADIACQGARLLLLDTTYSSHNRRPHADSSVAIELWVVVHIIHVSDEPTGRTPGEAAAEGSLVDERAGECSAC
jgi:hypothetical protein